jgi:hypothetical protein
VRERGTPVGYPPSPHRRLEPAARETVRATLE